MNSGCRMAWGWSRNVIKGALVALWLRLVSFDLGVISYNMQFESHLCHDKFIFFLCFTRLHTGVYSSLPHQMRRSFHCILRRGCRAIGHGRPVSISLRLFQALISHCYVYMYMYSGKPKTTIRPSDITKKMAAFQSPCLPIVSSSQFTSLLWLSGLIFVHWFVSCRPFCLCPHLLNIHKYHNSTRSEVWMVTT